MQLRPLFLIYMKHFPQVLCYRAVVGVGGHDFTHVGPPFSADFGPRDGVPARLILDFDVPK